jgi:hypothetical protein
VPLLQRGAPFLLALLSGAGQVDKKVRLSSPPSLPPSLPPSVLTPILCRSLSSLLPQVFIAATEYFQIRVSQVERRNGRREGA